MGQIEEIQSIITNKATPIEKLFQLSTSTSNTITRYSKGLELLKQIPGNEWTYENYLKVDQIVNGSSTPAVSRSDWERLNPIQRIDLRDKLQRVFLEGSQTFVTISGMILAELEKRKSQVAPTKTEPEKSESKVVTTKTEPEKHKSNKSWWQFWK